MMKNIIMQTMAKDKDHIINEFTVHNVFYFVFKYSVNKSK